MNFCSCGKCGVDLEEGYCRYSTNNPKDIIRLKTIEHTDMDIFYELCINYKEQGYPMIDTHSKNYSLYDFFKQIEREVLLDLVEPINQQT
jgi:hypothetical protein